MAIEWNGDATIDALRRLAGGVGRQIAQAVATEADKEAPVRTGFMKSTIAVEETRPDREFVVVVTAGYSVFVHEGTSRQDSNPFLLRAVGTVVGRWSHGGTIDAGL